MSTPAADMCFGPGIPSAMANAARNGCQATEREEGKPATFLNHNSLTRAASNNFLQGEKEELAKILGISKLHVKQRFAGSYPGVFNESQHTRKSGRTDQAHTILALGDLSYENGLPALGSAKVKYTLKSGEALHFMGDLEQTYGDGGGGTFIWFTWNNLP